MKRHIGRLRGAAIRTCNCLKLRIGSIVLVGGVVVSMPAAASDAVLTLRATTGDGGRTAQLLPLRVMLIVDGSASMTESMAGRTRWAGVQEKITEDIRQLAACGTPVDLTAVKFGRNSSRIDRPLWRGSMSGSADAGMVAADVVSRLGNADGSGTSLYGSVADAVNSMERDLSSRRFSGGEIIVYSDGADSSSDISLEKLLSDVRVFRQRNPRSNVSIRAFGEEAREMIKKLPGFVDLAGGLKLPPKLSSLEFQPSIVKIDPLRSARSQAISIQAPDITSEFRVSITVEARVEGRSPIELEPTADGWRGSVPLPQSESGADIEVVARAPGVPDARALLHAEALKLPANPSEWGLPSCDGGWGVACLVGEPLSLSVLVPADAVSWSELAGAWMAKGSSVVHPGFKVPGKYALKITVNAPDGSSSQDLQVWAVDPRLVIEGPASTDVGTEVEFKVAPSSPALQGGGAAGDVGAVRWYVDGEEMEKKGSSFQHTFGQRGKGAVSAQLSIQPCGKPFDARGAVFTAVNAVPSVELGDTELVRGGGDSNKVAVRVFVASRVGAVVLSFDGGEGVRVSVPEANSTGDATVIVPVPTELSARAGKFSVVATPQIKGDDGKVDSNASAKGAVRHDYVVREPRPGIAFLEPKAGQEASYEVAFPIKVVVTGGPADVAAVAAVLLKYSDGRPDERLTLDKDRVGSASCTPHVVSTGSDVLELTAVAVASDGSTVAPPVVRQVKLRQPNLQLRANTDVLHRTTLQPLDLTIDIVSSETNAGWEEGLAGTVWKVEPADAAIRGSESKTKLVLQVKGVTEIAVTAVVSRGGKLLDLGPVRVPIVVDALVPDFKVTELNSSSQIGTVIGERMLRILDETAGPCVSRKFQMRRAGGEWVEVNPESFRFAAAAQPGESVEVQGIFASVDGTMHNSTPREFTASPDHNWAIVVVVLLLCLGLTSASWFFTQNNDLLGAQCVWSADDMGNIQGSRMTIRWLAGAAQFSIRTKRASIPLPSMYGDGGFEWVYELRRKRVKLEIGGDLARPAWTNGDGGVPVSGGTGPRRQITLQPTSDGADPLYMRISPNGSTAMLGWMSLTVAATVIWAVFAFLFFRGYI